MKDDLQATAFMFLGIASIVLATVLFCVVAEWLSDVAWRLGLVSNASQWTIYLMSLCLCIGFVLTVAGRLVMGGWWFHDYPLPRDER